MNNLRLKALLGAGCFSLLMSGVANAGGFDRAGVNIDQLFDAAPYSFDAGVTYVSPQRTLKNVQRLDGSGLSSSSVDVGGDYAVPRIGIKANIFEPVDCLATYTEPYGAEAD
ncbi:MAG: transporter, partial [Mesorhizobium sp.]